MLLSKYKLDSINQIFSNYSIIQPPDYSKILINKQNIASKIINRNSYITYSHPPQIKKPINFSNFIYPTKYSTLPYNQQIHRSHLYNLHTLPQRPDDVRVIEIPQNLPKIIIPTSLSQPQPPFNAQPETENLPEVPDNLPEVPPDTIETPIETETQPHLIEEENQKIQAEATQAQTPIPVVTPTEAPVTEAPVAETPATEAPAAEAPAEAPAAQGKYSFPNNKVVDLPANYSTDSEEQNNAINDLNEDLASWELKVDEDDVKVYAKIVKVKDVHDKEWETAEMYVDSTINKPAAKVAETLHDLDLPKKMGRESKKSKVISVQDTPDGKIIEQYNYMKLPFPFDDRCTVTRNIIWNNFGGKQGATLSYLKSIQHPDFPEEEKPVRAEFLSRTTYVTPIDDNKCKMYLVNLMNMKMSMGASMMASKGSERQADWVKKFTKLV